MLFGEYDLIARVQADEEYALTRCIVEEIRQLPGIKDTKTLIGAEPEATARGGVYERRTGPLASTPPDGTNERLLEGSSRRC